MKTAMAMKRTRWAKRTRRGHGDETCVAAASWGDDEPSKRTRALKIMRETRHDHPAWHRAHHGAGHELRATCRGARDGEQESSSRSESEPATQQCGSLRDRMELDRTPQAHLATGRTRWSARE